MYIIHTHMQINMYIYIYIYMYNYIHYIDVDRPMFLKCPILAWPVSIWSLHILPSHVDWLRSHGPSEGTRASQVPSAKSQGLPSKDPRLLRWTPPKMVGFGGEPWSLKLLWKRLLHQTRPSGPPPKAWPLIVLSPLWRRELVNAWHVVEATRVKHRMYVYQPPRKMQTSASRTFLMQIPQNCLVSKCSINVGIAIFWSNREVAAWPGRTGHLHYWKDMEVPFFGKSWDEWQQVSLDCIHSSWWQAWWKYESVCLVSSPVKPHWSN